MSLKWYLVKHVPDLRRREPVNIGVILLDETDSSVQLSRFWGEDEQGNIDGRTVQQFGNHLVYKAWVKQWRQLLEGGIEAVEQQAVNGRSPGASFFIEAGGEYLVGDWRGEPAELLPELYADLVRDEMGALAAEDVRALSETVLRSIGVHRRVQRRTSLSIETHGVVDELWFDYRYDNGRPNLLQRVGLTSGDKSAWDRLHLVETTFERLEASAIFKDFGAVALVKQEGADPRLAQAVSSRLAQVATIVDVSDKAGAAGSLAEIFHLPHHETAGRMGSLSLTTRVLPPAPPHPTA